MKQCHGLTLVTKSSSAWLLEADMYWKYGSVPGYDAFGLHGVVSYIVVTSVVVTSMCLVVSSVAITVVYV